MDRWTAWLNGIYNGTMRPGARISENSLPKNPCGGFRLLADWHTAAMFDPIIGLLDNTMSVIDDRIV